MADVDLHVGLHWIWAVIAVVTIILPLFLWKAHRRLIGCSLCVAGISLVSFAWIRDFNSQDVLWFTFCEFPGRDYRLYEAHVQSMLGHMGFSHQIRYAPDQDSSIIPSDMRDRWVFHWSRKEQIEVDSMAYRVGPSPPLLYLHGGGFELLIEHDPPGSPFISYPRLWALVLPDWFIVLLLAIYPAWVIGHYRETKWYRRRHFLCLQCGYSLQGLTAPIICPECGATHAQVDTKLGTKTPAID